MKKKELYSFIISYFQEHMPVAETELHYRNPFELLVAVILSAQCTDKRVNLITPELFQHFPDPETLAASEPEVVFEWVRSCSYPSNKSKHLVGMARMLVRDFGGQVPDSVDALMKLPGVGRKTANVVVSVAFQQPAIAVDTHVFRVAARIGLTQEARTPLDAETQLVQYFPEQLHALAHHWLILHGRYVCKARKPLCDSCGLTTVCAYFRNQKLDMNNSAKLS